MRGFFGVGVEGISKEANVGNLVRSTHAFGGSFFFSIAPDVDIHGFRVSDTSNAFNHMPYYQYEKTADLALPEGTQLVGVEFVDESIDLPSFRHPLRAAYVLGPEMGSLSPELVEMCDHIIKIPMKFCINVGVAGAIVLYDRVLSMGEFNERPVKAGGPVELAGTPEQDLPVITGHRRRIRQKKI